MINCSLCGSVEQAAYELGEQHTDEIIMRTKLPNRRQHETEILELGPPGGAAFKVFVSAGYDDFGRLREAFVRVGGRVGSDRDFLLDDIAVLISRELQHEDSLDSMAAGMGRDETGHPTSLVGAVIDLLTKMQSEHQMSGAAAERPALTPSPD